MEENRTTMSLEEAAEKQDMQELLEYIRKQVRLDAIFFSTFTLMNLHIQRNQRQKIIRYLNDSSRLQFNRFSNKNNHLKENLDFLIMVLKLAMRSLDPQYVAHEALNRMRID